VEAHAIWDKATRIAKVILAQEGETRTLAQIRADVIADLLIDGRTDLHPAEARGIRATVAVTVPVLTLLDPAPHGAEPAVVEGVGPIPVGRPANWPVERRGGCGSSPIPRPGWSSPSDGIDIRRRRACAGW